MAIPAIGCAVCTELCAKPSLPPELLEDELLDEELLEDEPLPPELLDDEEELLTSPPELDDDDEDELSESPPELLELEVVSPPELELTPLPPLELLEDDVVTLLLGADAGVSLDELPPHAPNAPASKAISSDDPTDVLNDIFESPLVGQIILFHLFILYVIH